MTKSFTQYAFTPTVKDLQSRFKSRPAYERMEKSADRYILGAGEASFIQSRTSFYLSTIGENGWPYLQHRGGQNGFLKIVDATTPETGNTSAPAISWTMKRPVFSSWTTQNNNV